MLVAQLEDLTICKTIMLSHLNSSFFISYICFMRFYAEAILRNVVFRSATQE